MLMLDSSILQPFLNRLPPATQYAYHGIQEPKMVRFAAEYQDQPVTIYLKNLIHHEEALAWKSFDELLRYSVKMAQELVKGFYGLEMFYCHSQQNLSQFSPQDFSTLVLNHSRKLMTGGKCLIRYGVFAGCLTKRVEEDWGKIDFLTSVEVIHKEREQFDLVLKAAASKIPERDRSVWILLNNISDKPLWIENHPEQEARMRKTYKAQISLRQNITEAMILDPTQVVHLNTLYGQ